ncbi:unnamed protein product, partial [Nesidiocoris tenuis]
QSQFLLSCRLLSDVSHRSCSTLKADSEISEVYYNSMNVRWMTVYLMKYIK